MWARVVSNLLAVEVFPVTLDMDNSLGTAKLSTKLSRILHARWARFADLVAFCIHVLYPGDAV